MRERGIRDSELCCVSISLAQTTRVTVSASFAMQKMKERWRAAMSTKEAKKYLSEMRRKDDLKKALYDAWGKPEKIRRQTENELIPKILQAEMTTLGLLRMVYFGRVHWCIRGLDRVCAFCIVASSFHTCFFG